MWMQRYYHQYNRTSIMAALRMYRERIRYLSSAEIVEQRREIFRTLNGDAFFPLKRWPDDMRIIFWRKPIGDQQTFKLLLFCIGNVALRTWFVLGSCYPRPGQPLTRQRSGHDKLTLSWIMQTPNAIHGSTLILIMEKSFIWTGYQKKLANDDLLRVSDIQRLL